MRTYGECRRPQLCKGPIRSSGRSGSAGPPSGGCRAGGRPGGLRIYPRPCWGYAVSPFTFDADLALIPELLAEDPRVIAAMQNAGYKLTDQWWDDDGSKFGRMILRRSIRGVRSSPKKWRTLQRVKTCMVSPTSPMLFSSGLSRTRTPHFHDTKIPKTFVAFTPTVHRRCNTIRSAVSKDIPICLNHHAKAQ